MANFSKYIDIDQFLLTANLNDGLPFINRFVCRLTKGKDPTNTEKFIFHVLSCDVPNIAIGVSESDLFGERRYTFTKREDGDLGITYLETPNLMMRLFFNNWMKMALDVTHEGRTIRQYPDKVTQGSTIEVFPLDNMGNAIICDVFKDLVPYDISSISYTYADTEVIKTTVKFKYKFHHLLPIKEN
jgi:hypothetical protein